jgi:formate-dependent phosphoribosylglycinamide formyltransferase (GAR transformylase)
MSQKVLLVDTGFSSQPIYQSILDLGYDVHVVGGRPDDALARIAEQYWCLDYSDTDKLSELIKQENYQYIVPGCTDRSYTSCSVVGGDGASQGIEPPENDATINLKHCFRRLCKDLRISIPEVVTQFQHHVFPLIVKPVDGYSGNGISIVDRTEQMEEAIALATLASPTQRYVCEQYIKGQLFSHSAFLGQGRVVQDFIVQEDSTVSPFAVDLSFVIHDYPKKNLDHLRESVEKIAEYLGLQDGLVHTQFIQSGDQLYLIEMTRRCPGDLYSQLIELQTGFPYVENYVRPFLGMELNIAPLSSEPHFVIRHTVSASQGQVFTGLKFSDDFNLDRWVPLAVAGDWLDEGPRGRAGIVFIGCKDNDDLKSTYSKFSERKAYQML